MRYLIVFGFFFLTFSTASAQQDKYSFNLHGNGMEFVKNAGQIVDMDGHLRPDILYAGNGGGAKVFLRKNTVSYVYTIPSYYGDTEDDKQKEALEKQKHGNSTIAGCRLDMEFKGAAENINVTEELVSEGSFNFYYPHCPTGIINVKAYNKITYKEIYAHTDVVFYGGKENGLKYDIIVKPGGDVSKIKLVYAGAEGLEISKGRLYVKTKLGEREERIPKIIQYINGKEILVKGGYLLNNNEVGFVTAEYNKNFPLIIDPWWSTYYGANTSDYATGDAIDNSDNIIITGATQSTNFPTTPGAFQSANAGGGGTQDVIVLKFTSAGARTWATYYGGSGDDIGMGVAVDASDNIAICGHTTSKNFPVTAGAYQSVNQATGALFVPGTSAFLIKFNSAGAQQFATYCGGDGMTKASGVAVDLTNGNFAITGETTSSTLFPVSAGAYQSAKAGGPGTYDAFAAEFGPTGNNIWATYYGGGTGGNADDRARAVAIDKSGNVFITGWTTCSDFPTTAGAFQTMYKGGTYGGNAFVVKFNPTGARQWATLFGGSVKELGSGIAIDKNDDVVFVGLSQSADMPVSAGAYQTTNANIPTGSASFVAKFTNAGARIWSTYYNVVTENGASAVAVDINNFIYVVDDVEVSSGTPMIPKPIAGCVFDNTFDNSKVTVSDTPEDQCIAKFTPAGFLMCSTYLGGDKEDEHETSTKSISVKNCKMVIVGGTAGGTFPLSAGAYQSTKPGTNTGNVCFITSLSTFACGVTAPTIGISPKVASSGGCKAKADFIATICDSIDTIGVTYSWLFPGGVPSSGTGKVIKGIDYPGSGSHLVTLKIGTCAGDIFTTTTTITTPANGVVGVPKIVTPKCKGDNNGTITITPNSGTSPYTYSWLTMGSTGATVNGLAAGTYTCVVTDNAGAGCVDTVKVIVKDPTVITFQPFKTTPTACGQNTGTATAAATGGTGKITYTWSNNATGATVSNLSAGNYNVTAVDSNGCTAIASTSITSTSGSGLMVSPSSVKPNCTGSNNGKAIVNVNGGVSPYTYSWLVSGGNKDTLTGLPPGTYTCVVKDNSGSACLDTIKVVVTDPAPLVMQPIVTTPPTCGQNDGKATASASGGTGKLTYSWTNGVNGSTGATATNLSAGNYSVTVTDSSGCTKTASTILNNSNAPAAHATATLNAITQGSSSTLTGSGGTIYLWKPDASLSCNTCVSPVATPKTTTAYTLVVKDASGCEDSTYITITVNPDGCSGERDLFIPNSFSPNGDGANDVLFIRGSGLADLYWAIYNRWGEKIFSSTDPLIGWDGTFNGHQLNTGVYVYYLQATCIKTNAQIVLKGNITLVR